MLLESVQFQVGIDTECAIKPCRTRKKELYRHMHSENKIAMTSLPTRVFFKLFPEGVKSTILYPFMILNMHLKG